MALTDKLTAIADAIRAKTGKTDALTLEQMPTEIAGIQTGGDDVASGEIVLVPKTTFTMDDDYTPYTGIEIPDDIDSASHEETYAVYFDGQLYDNPKFATDGKYGNSLWWMGPDDGTPFLLVAGEGIYAYTGEHNIRIIKIL